MEIRKAVPADLSEVMAIYAYARRFMAEHGNPRQWGPTNWPPEDLIRQDMAEGKSYVCVEGERILAVFYYDQGKGIEPTYRNIEDGQWEDPVPYVVVHRIAAAEGARGAGTFCLNWAFSRCGHLRMDTHGDNKPMQALLTKLGFQYRGIIHVVEDNDPRLAFEKSK